MLKIEYEFSKGILFIRLKGIFTKKTIEKTRLENKLSEMSFKYIVFNISNIKQIDGYGIKYLINYNNKVKEEDGKAIICQSNISFIDKFIPKMEIIKNEKEVLNVI